MSATLTAKERRLRDLARKHGTPLMVISRSVLRDQLDRFRRALPRVEPFFAIKANSHPEIIKTMVAGRASFDVASVAEMNQVLAAKAKPSQIIFANTVKPVESIAHAAKKGVTLMTFDSEYELAKIAEHAPGARVLVRIKVPNVGSIVELSLKFGVDPADATSLHDQGVQDGPAARRRQLPRGQPVHARGELHRGDGDGGDHRPRRPAQTTARSRSWTSAAGFRSAISTTRTIRSTAWRPCWPKNSTGCSTRTSASSPSRAASSSGPAATLLMRVIGKAIRENKLWYYLDDGLYGSLSGQVFDHCKYQFKYLRGGHTQLSTLAGPTCDSFDIIARGEDVPELQIGDVVYVENIGAYSLASATTFNGMPMAKVVMVP